MKGKKKPAILIAATQSGAGKTTVTLGLLSALIKKGLTVQPFKCGPDFIDPTLHRLATGKSSRNLDLWMMGEKAVRRTFSNTGTADISVIEGVMGMFDGGKGSAASLSKSLDVPIILILDVRSAAESMAAVLKGFEVLDPDVAPRGVILNRVGSPRHLALVKEAIEKHCSSEILGYLPRDLNFEIPSRHLGLLMGEEEPVSGEALSDLAATLASHVDLDRILEIADESRRIAETNQAAADKTPLTVRIGVARDRAFCFYYDDTFDYLREAGAEPVFFSPLLDEKLPDGIDGLYLGGGYPELFAHKLSKNTGMKQAVHDWAEEGKPLYAECGGFMYLTQGIVDSEDFHPMAGIFPVRARMKKTRASLGYREISLKKECLLGPAGTVLRGHEFHYSDIDRMPDSVERIYQVNNDTEEGYSYKNVLGGYIHLHFGSCPEAIETFVQACQG